MNFHLLGKDGRSLCGSGSRSFKSLGHEAPHILTCSSVGSRVGNFKLISASTKIVAEKSLQGILKNSQRLEVEG